jgi:uncharacterized protein (TIGR03437 family)
MPKRAIAAVVAAFLFSSFAIGQTPPLQCTFNAAITPTIRAEGLTELVGDIVLNCSGGTPTANGQPVPSADLTVFLSTSITSRVTATGYSEALLIFDEPHSVVNPSVPMLVCGAPSTNDDGTGTCSVAGTGSGKSTYDGSVGHPNVFQAQSGTLDSLVWKGIPIDPPGSTATRIIRITNLRANASQIGVSTGLIPSQVVAALSISTPSLLPLNNPQQTVAFIANGVRATASTAATLAQCTPSNAAIAGDASKPLDSGAQNGQQFTIRIDEGFPFAWKEKNIQYHISNANLSPPYGVPSISAQDVPGANYFTEAGFITNGITPAPVTPPPGYGPFLSANTAFPQVRGVDTAGTANTGTRLYVRFTSVPAGVKLFAPVRLSLVAFGTGGPPYQPGFAVLTSGSAAGSGVFSPVSGNTAGVAPLTVTAGTALAVYEILYSDPFSYETVNLPVAAAYADPPAAGTISVQVGLAPFDATAVASDSTVPIPRFTAPAGSSPAFVIQSCASADFTVAVAHSDTVTQGDFATPYTVTVSNIGAGSSSGQVNVNVTLPAGLIPTSIKGTGWTCSLFPLGCTRNDNLAAGASFPPINVTADVDLYAAASLAVRADVSGGNDTVTSNNSATDTTTIVALPVTTVTTSPAQATVVVDGIPYRGSNPLKWRVGSTHTLSVVAPQIDAGKRYTLIAWSDGGAASHTVTAGNAPATFAATFNTDYQLVATATAGGSVTPPVSGFYPPGTVVTVTAMPAANYMFSGWLGPVASQDYSTTVTMSGPVSVMAQFVPYEAPRLPQVITFDPIPDHTLGDAPFQISARAESTLPVTFAVASGPATVSGNVVTLTGTGVVSIRASQSGNTLFDPAPDVVRSFHVNPAQHPVLTLSASPASSGSVAATPDPTDGGYELQTSVTITAVPKPGFVFVGFSGDLSGAANPQTLVMSANRTVTANFVPVSGNPKDHVTFGAEDGAVPAARTVSTALPVTAASIAVSTTSGGSWLRAAAAAPTGVVISIDPAVLSSLASGTYTGYVVVGANPSARVITVDLVVNAVKVTRITDAASYTEKPVAPGALFTLFGMNLAGATVTITDQHGLPQSAVVQYASAEQVTFVAPAPLVAGPATLTITNAAGRKTSTVIQIADIAPSLFSADMTGAGTAAAFVTTVARDGSASESYVADCTAPTGQCSPSPVDVSDPEATVYLSLFGTGIRGRSDLGHVVVTAGDLSLEVVYAGAQGEYPGLDQVNVRLPRGLAGRGDVEAVVARGRLPRK